MRLQYQRMLRERAENVLMNLRTSQVNQFHVFVRGIPITLQVFGFYGNDR